MRYLFLIICGLILSSAVVGQSGRNKQTESDAPPRVRPTIDLPPSSRVIVKTSATPAPTPPVTKPTDDDDVIKVDSTLVPIPVSITDAAGQAVANLKISDFELRVNNEAQEISDLARSDTPVRLALLFDNSSSATSARQFEIKAATQFLKKVLRPDRDRAALYSVSSVSRLEQPMTGDTRRLAQAIEMFPTPAGATALLDGIVEAAKYLRDFNDGRRVIVIVSDGVDTLSDINLTLEATVKSLQLADCQVYVVKTTDFENFQRSGIRRSSANLQDLTAERRMQEITAQTGGAVYSPLDEKELNAAFAQIGAELAQQYILSYYPAEQKRDGSFKQISLAVKSNKNLTIRTRKGYYVPKS